jgi:tetratricopeptide (TPR) repeat protein
MKKSLDTILGILFVTSSLILVTACTPKVLKEQLITTQNSPLELARIAYKYVEKGDRRKADDLINRSLHNFPNNSVLHSVRGALFKIHALEGDVSAARNAETGFRFAVASDPSNKFASRSYSEILLSKGDYNKVISVLSKRLYAFPDDADALHKIAIASYLNGDPYTAAGALDRAQAIEAPGVNSTSLFAIVTAAIGDYQSSRNSLTQLYNMESGEKKIYHYTKKRVAEWTQVAKSLNEETEFNKNLQNSAIITLNKNRQNKEIENNFRDTGKDEDYRTPKWGCGADEATTDNPDSELEFAAGSFPARSLPAIISPSSDYAPPAMVAIDAIFVRSEDVVGKTYGINLLDLLRANFSISKSKTKDTADGNSTILTQAWSIFSDQNLSYSLNIANNFSNRAEVLNRPTLTTLNCRSAHFFSGQEVSVIAGSEDSSLIEKPIGVGITLTPTILDSETVILNLALARTFLEVASNVAPSLNQTLQTSSTLLNTSVVLKFGETLIVSGITSTDRLRNKQGVPLLEKLPIIQYLSSNRLDTDNEKSVLVFLTPRRPSYTQNATQGVDDGENDDDETRWVKKMLRKKYTPPNNTTSTLAHLVKNRYYRYIRRGDAVGEPWSNYRSVEGQLKILKEFLWY